MRTFTKDTALSEHGRGTAGARHGMCELAFIAPVMGSSSPESCLNHSHVTEHFKGLTETEYSRSYDKIQDS